MGFLKGLLGLGVTAGAAFAALKVAQKYEENKAAGGAGGRGRRRRLCRLAQKAEEVRAASPSCTKFKIFGKKGLTLFLPCGIILEQSANS